MLVSLASDVSVRAPALVRSICTGDGAQPGCALGSRRRAARPHSPLSTRAVAPVHVHVLDVLGAGVGDRAGEARGRPDRHRPCLALVGRAVRVERQRGWHIGDLDGEGSPPLAPRLLIGRGQLDRVSAAGREGVVSNAVAGDRPAV